MKDQKKEKTKDRFQAEFEALPLEEKFAKLFRMEAVTFTEAFNYAVNSPMKVVEKVGDAISELGVKLETEIKNAAQSRHACKPGAAKGPAAKPKSRTADGKPASPRAPKA